MDDDDDDDIFVMIVMSYTSMWRKRFERSLHVPHIYGFARCYVQFNQRGVNAR